MQQHNTKGFTLIEFLVAVAIVSILASITIIALNPVEKFRQARDSQRIADMVLLANSLEFYVAAADNPDMNGPSSSLCQDDYWATSNQATVPMFLNTSGALNGAHGTDIDGTGWVPVAFDQLTAGEPITILPIDPANNATYHYQYQCNNTANTFELNARLESTRFSSGGSDDLESTDGGDVSDVYERGNEPSLDL